MKKIYLSILILSISVINSQAQSLWGVDAGIDVENAQFQNAFVETTTAGSYATDNWTALSVYEEGNIAGGNAFWKRSTEGRSVGAYVDDRPVISSPSQPNGVAIFDSDFLDNGGTAEAFGAGTSPSSHSGEL